jgi:hypothetical protein
MEIVERMRQLCLNPSRVKGEKLGIGLGFPQNRDVVTESSRLKPRQLPKIPKIREVKISSSLSLKRDFQMTFGKLPNDACVGEKSFRVLQA